MKKTTFFILALASQGFLFADETPAPSIDDTVIPVTIEEPAKGQASADTPPNGIAATVDDVVITIKDIRTELDPVVPQLQRETLTEIEFKQRIDAIAREILENLIDRELIVKEFETKKMRIPQTYLDNEYSEFISKNFEGDRTEFLEFLKAQGKTIRQFKEELRKNLIVSVMRQQKMKSQAEVSPEKILAYYQEHPNEFLQKEGLKLRQITLAPYTNESKELLAQEAEKIIEDLRSGKSFYEVAKKHSQDHMKESGGDWGWINRTDIRKELADVAFALPKNTYSEPIYIDNYMFILFVEDKREEGVMPLEEVRAVIEQKLANQLAKQAQETWIQRLRGKAHIQYFL